jgi:hypothetical protein
MFMCNRKYKIVSIIMLAFLVSSFVAIAQSGDGFTITKKTIDNGGGTSNGGGFIVSGTIGQVDATNELIGDGFKLTGGFWAQKTIPLPDGMFSDGFEDLLIIKKWKTK